MKEIQYKVLIVLGLLFIFLGLDNNTVYAEEKGGVRPLKIELDVYTDIINVEKDEAKGGYVNVSVNTYATEGENWQGNQFIINKVKKLAEDALKKKTGKNYSVVSLIKPYDEYYYTDSYYQDWVYVKNDTNKDLIDIQFDYTYYDDRVYSLKLNLFASENGPINGWKLFGEDARFYENNVFKTGVQKVGNTTYLFTKNGSKQYGWHSVNGWNMYFNEQNGGLWTGKRKIGATTYLFDSNGHKIDGWHRLNGKDYFFNKENGGMWTGKRKIGQTTYLLHNEGNKIFGWFVDSEGDKYYFDPNYGGGMITGFRKVGNAYYYFDTTDGQVLTNSSRTINHQNWYFNNKGIGTVTN